MGTIGTVLDGLLGFREKEKPTDSAVAPVDGVPVDGATPVVAADSPPAIVPPVSEVAAPVAEPDVSGGAVDGIVFQ